MRRPYTLYTYLIVVLGGYTRPTKTRLRLAIEPNVRRNNNIKII